jgi:hypothetical protein
MKDETARHGVLLLISARAPKEWGPPRSRIEKFSGLILHLKAQATALCAVRPEIEGLIVMGIDFH